MKRTRKWSYVEQEAKRLSALGLDQSAIAKRLGVNKSTVNRWVAAGKLTVPKRLTLSGTGQNPGSWAASVRKDYALDASDDQLVTIGEAALGMALDPSLAAHVRMTAAGRFQAILRQLALVARRADVESERPVKPEPKPEPVMPRRVDPRKVLMTVN